MMKIRCAKLLEHYVNSEEKNLIKDEQEYGVLLDTCKSLDSFLDKVRDNYYVKSVDIKIDEATKEISFCSEIQLLCIDNYDIYSEDFCTLLSCATGCKISLSPSGNLILTLT